MIQEQSNITPLSRPKGDINVEIRTVTLKHDDVIKWKHFPCNWHFVYVGISPVIGEFPSQRPVTRSFDVFFHLCLYKRLSKTLVRLAIWDAIVPIMTSL